MDLDLCLSQFRRCFGLGSGTTYGVVTKDQEVPSVVLDTCNMGEGRACLSNTTGYLLVECDERLVPLRCAAVEYVVEREPTVDHLVRAMTCVDHSPAVATRCLCRCLLLAGSDVVVVKNGHRICGTGAALATVPIVQNKAYFEGICDSVNEWLSKLYTHHD